MIYLYAIIEPRSGLPDVRGLDDQPLGLIEHDGLAAVYTTHTELEPRPEPETLWRHELVVERLMELGAILPFRFGTTFSDAEALAASLSDAAARLRPRLEHVRGYVELAVRVRGPSADTLAPLDGRAYMETKLSRRRSHESIAQRTLVPLSRLAAESRHSQSAADPDVISASYLVREGDVPRFADQVRLIQQEHEELMLSCTGPWAPYSFTGEKGP